MAKNYNTKLIKTRQSYTSKQISELFNTHTKTVQLWVKDGLPAINNKPILIMGSDLKRFLDKKQQDRKCKLAANEFYCTKCRKAVVFKDDSIKLIPTGKTIGKKAYKEIVLKAVCNECGSRINRFSHSGKLDEIKEHFYAINLEDIYHGK